MFKRSIELLRSRIDYLENQVINHNRIIPSLSESASKIREEWKKEDELTLNDFKKALEVLNNIGKESSQEHLASKENEKL